MNDDNKTLKNILLGIVIFSALSLAGILSWFIYDQGIKKDTTTTTIAKGTTTTRFRPQELPAGFSLVFDSPLAGSTVSGNVLVKVTVGSEEDIEKVELYVDGVLKETDSDYAYTLNLNASTLSSGSHTLKAIAYDVNGQKAEKEIQISK